MPVSWSVRLGTITEEDAASVGLSPVRIGFFKRRQCMRVQGTGYP